MNEQIHKECGGVINQIIIEFYEYYLECNKCNKTDFETNFEINFFNNGEVK